MILEIYISDSMFIGEDLSIPALGINLEGISVEIIDERKKDEEE